MPNSSRRRAGTRRVLCFRAALEACEPRLLLTSTPGRFAVVDQPAGPEATHRFAVRLTDTRPAFSGQVLMTLVCEPAASGADPGPIAVTDAAGARVRPLVSRPDVAGGTSSLCIVPLGPGRYQAGAGSAPDDATGPTRLLFSLTGDVDGDVAVTRRDLAAIRSTFRAGPGTASAASPPTDVDGDGRVTRADLALARRNLGASTRLRLPETALPPSVDGDPKDPGTTTPRPLAATLELSVESDPDGDGVVVTPDVTVRGRAQAGARVRLTGDDGAPLAPAITAAADGTFLATAHVPMGDSTIAAEVTDGLGRTTGVAIPVHRRDLAIDWSTALLDAIRATRNNPPAASRQMAVLGVAMYDAVDSIDRAFDPYYRFVAAPQGASREAAVAAAAHRVLAALYPDRAATSDALLVSSLADVPDGPGEEAGVVLGASVAEGILALRSNDGSGNRVTAPTGTEPGQWRPTPPGFLPPLLPGWGSVTPFALTDATQFRIPPPPGLASPEYAAALDEVKALGNLHSTARTRDETDLARFWADAAGTATPPGHWFRIAATIGSARDQSLLENARMFALVGIALADAAITCWNDKYEFNFWRPITAIREADGDGNPDTAADPAWAPLLTTPNFPGHGSGHSTFSAAAATVLASLLGTDAVPFTATSEGFDVPARTFRSLSEAAYEAGRSRVVGGIHFTFENLAGRAVGTALAQYVADNFLRPRRRRNLSASPVQALSPTPDGDLMVMG